MASEELHVCHNKELPQMEHRDCQTVEAVELPLVEEHMGLMGYHRGWQQMRAAGRTGWTQTN